MREHPNQLILGRQRPLVVYAPGYAAHAGPAGPHVGAAGPDAGQQSDANVLRALLRHFWLVLLFGVLGAAGAALYLKYATPLYRSSAKIYIEQIGSRVIGETFNSVRRDNWLETQCSVIRSAPVLSLVAEAPGIDQLHTFEGWGEPANYLRSKKHLETEVGRKDDLITISVYTPHREDAAPIVNAVVDAFTRYANTEKRTRSSDLLNTYLEAKNRSDQEIKKLSDALYQFKRDHPDLALDQALELQLRTISQALVQAQIDAIDARGRYAENHPQRQAAERRESELLRASEDVIQQSTHLNSLQAEHQRMTAELTSKQELARVMEGKIRELEVNKDAEQVFRNITPIEIGRVPEGPDSPSPLRTYAIALMAGVLLGGGLALVRDRLDTRMRSVEEIQTIVGLPVLGVVPAMSGRRTAVARAMTVHLDPRSVVAESYRTIRTALYFGAGERAIKTILVTSPEAGDGKTTSASNLAIAIAQTGRRVLLLDADFRKPTQHKNLAVKDAQGLSSVLAGREPLSNVLQHTGVEGLDILPCGPIPANPSEILNSREFGELVDEFASKYDHIIFDSPPVNAVTDARILGAVCDATVLVIRADKSTRQSAEHARNALLAVGARVVGVIVNDAPRRRGYDIYGGSYYGQTDIVVRSHDGYDGAPAAAKVANPKSGVAE